MSKYIIGGGIAGLIASFYNPDYRIITDNVGGQMNNQSAGPRILEVNEYSESFLKDLGFKDLKIKVAKIGYKIRNDIVSSVGEDLRLKYYLKSRCLRNINNVPSSIMSDGKNTIEYFDIDWKDLILRLYSNIKNPVIGKVSKIDVKNKTFVIDKGSFYDEFDYSDLISTIPAPIFFNIASIKPEEELKYLRKIFIITSEYFMNTYGYDYIYYPEDKYQFHRISKVGKGKVSIEFTTNESYLSILKEWDERSSQHVIIPIGQIQSGKVQKIEDILFLGRYACWDHDIKTDDVIKQCKKGVIING